MDQRADEGGRQQGFGRLVAKALAVASALTFLAIVMVNACAQHGGAGNAPPPGANAPPYNPALYAAPTKAAPVMAPTPLVEPAPAKPPRRATPPTQAAPQQQAQPQQGGW